MRHALEPFIVSFFTRDQGKLSGVAHHARRPKSSFGSGMNSAINVGLIALGRSQANECWGAAYA